MTNMMDNYDYLFKFLIIGNAGAGKTCILRRFLDNCFKENSVHTIGVEFGTKLLTVNGKSIKLQIWDTAGQERFQCVTRSYYRGAVGCLIVYDITNRDSFNQVANWLATARELSSSNLVTILVGNKADLAATSREVNTSDAEQFYIENKLNAFLETSAKSGDNVADTFVAATRAVLENAMLTHTQESHADMNGHNSNVLFDSRTKGQSRSCDC
ncbi:Ras- protein Rab-4A [Cichlidogyrus casuarinus]|uniref:Ras- protein Rab-4A n=1 Tax=Cichlidogyrus casuarinus TaxID=1844966 RepID=A0ABD2QKM3_9PLAT